MSIKSCLPLIAGLLLSPTLSWATAPQDLSHVSFVTNSDGSPFHTIKTYLRDGKKMRVEYLSPEGTVNAVGIYRKDRGLVWGVEAETRTFTQKKMAADDWDRVLFSVFPEPGQTLKKTGETRCSHFDCDILESDLGTLSVTYTVIRNMNVIMKSEMKQNGKIVQVSETTELKLEKPAAVLFELPSGLKRRAIVQ